MGKLITAVCDNNKREVKRLLEGEYKNSPGINEVDDLDSTALFIAAERGHAEIVQALLKAGAKLEQQNNEGRPPLYIAAKNGHKSVVEALLKAGAKVDLAEKDGQTPLYIAAKNGHKSVVEALLKAGAKVDQGTKHGDTPLWTAAFRVHPEITQILLKAGAKVDQPNNRGETALHTLVEFFSEYRLRESEKVAKALLLAGADMHKKDSKGKSPFMIAKEKGHTALVSLMEAQDKLKKVQGGPSTESTAKVTSSTKESKSDKLTYALLCQHMPEIKRLLEGEYKNNPAINQFDDNGQAPLYIAALSKNTEAIQLLLREGANVDLAQNGETPLYIAAYNGNVAAVEVLLKAGAKVDQQDNDGYTPLYIAASEGHVAAVEALLKAGAKVDLVQRSGKTPLYVAAQRGHVEVVQALLLAGADMHKKDKYGTSPFMIAQEEAHSAIVSLMEAQDKLKQAPVPSTENKTKVTFNTTGSGRGKLIAAVLANNMPEIKRLLEGGYKNSSAINEVDNEGKTPLWMAAYHGHVEVVQALLKAGATVDLATNDGVTPLSIAAFQDRLKVVQVLLNAGAKVDFARKDGRTPLYMAADGGQLQIVEALLKAGAKVDLVNEEGATPLHIAAWTGNIAVAQALLKAGAKMDVVMQDGRTSLFFAAFKGRLEVVQVLLKAGAKVDLADEGGETPLYTAAQQGHEKVVQALLLAGADMHQQNKEGKSPFMLAKEKGHTAIVSLMEKHDAPKPTPAPVASALKATPPVVELRPKTVHANANKGVIVQALELKLNNNVANASESSSKSATQKQQAEAEVHALKANLERVETEKSALASLSNADMQKVSQQLQSTLQQELIEEKRRFEALEKEQATLKQQQETLTKTLAGKSDKSELTDITARLEEVEAQTAILMNEYEIKAKKREALQRFNSHPNLLLFYRTVHIKLEDIFISMKAVSGGFVDATQGELSIAQSVVEGLGDVASLVPVIGSGLKTVLKWTGQVIGKADNVRQNNIASNASALVTLSEVKKYAESAARQLTESYAEQLTALATLDDEQNAANRLQRGVQKVKETVHQMPVAPAKQLASYAVLWMVDVIHDAKGMMAPALDNVLLTQVTQKAPPEKIARFWDSISTPLGLTGLRTQEGAFWKPVEVLTLPGVKVREGNQFQFYASQRLNPAKFGWRIGTLEDTQALQLQRVPNPQNTSNAVQPAKETEGLKKVLQHQAVDLQAIKKRQELHDKGGNIIGGARVQELEKQLAEEKRKAAEREEQQRKEAEQREERLRREMAEKEERIRQDMEAKMEARFAAMQSQFAAMQVGQSSANPSELPPPNRTLLPSHNAAAASASNANASSANVSPSNTNRAPPPPAPKTNKPSFLGSK